MHVLRKILAWMGGGAVLGLLIASFSVSRYLPWYNQPGQGEQTLCDMGQVTRRIVATVYHSQWIGAAIGAGVGLIIAVVLLIRGRKHVSPAEAPPPSV
jgi:hypothetical protein